MSMGGIRDHRLPCVLLFGSSVLQEIAQDVMLVNPITGEQNVYYQN